MKISHHFFVILLVSTLWGLYSCSEESQVVNTASNTQAQVLIDLYNVNQEICKDVPKSTRGWSQWTTKQRMAVVAADVGGAWKGGKYGAQIGSKVGLLAGSPITGGVFGAVLGGMVTGSVSSWMAAPETRALSNRDIPLEKVCTQLLNEDLSLKESALIPIDAVSSLKLNLDKHIIEASKLDSLSLNVGKVHNAILSVMDGSVTLKETPQEANSSSIRSALLNDSLFIQDCKISGIAVTLGEVDTNDALLDGVRNLFNQVLEKYSSNTSDVAFIIGKYIEVIEASNELTEEQKRIIKIGLSTALYSSSYWDKTYTNKYLNRFDK